MKTQGRPQSQNIEDRTDDNSYMYTSQALSEIPPRSLSAPSLDAKARMSGFTVPPVRKPTDY